MFDKNEFLTFLVVAKMPHTHRRETIP